MKLRISFVLIVIAFAVSIFCQDAQQKPDFRKASWGTTKEEVSAAEGIEVVHWSLGHYKLDSIETILGLETVVFYYFYESKLVYAGYEFNDHSNDVYDALGDKLKEKYGEPEYFDERIWIESRNYFDNFINQCIQGKMRWESKWPLGKTIIYLRQESNGSGGIRLRLYYISTDYEKSLQSGASDQDKL